MNKDIRKNDIIKIQKNGQTGWQSCLIIVTDVKSWGIVGYIHIPCRGDAYIRVPFDELELVFRPDKSNEK